MNLKKLSILFIGLMLLSFMSCTTNGYKIKFNTDGGETVDTFIVNDINNYTIPIIISKEGYIFEGWYLDKSFEHPFDKNEYIISKNFTLYAKWEEMILLSKDRVLEFVDKALLNQVPLLTGKIVETGSYDSDDYYIVKTTYFDLTDFYGYTVEEKFYKDSDVLINSRVVFLFVKEEKYYFEYYNLFEMNTPYTRHHRFDTNDDELLDNLFSHIGYSPISLNFAYIFKNIELLDTNPPDYIYDETINTFYFKESNLMVSVVVPEQGQTDTNPNAAYGELLIQVNPNGFMTQIHMESIELHDTYDNSYDAETIIEYNIPIEKVASSVIIK
jgi:uncharacterized repeat protein (TIGR02543 family)